MTAALNALLTKIAFLYKSFQYFSSPPKGLEIRVPCRNITNIVTTSTTAVTTTVTAATTIAAERITTTTPATTSNNLVILRSSSTKQQQQQYSQKDHKRRPLSSEGLPGLLTTKTQPLRSHHQQQQHLLKSSSTPDILEPRKRSSSPQTSFSSDPMLLDTSSALSSSSLATDDESVSPSRLKGRHHLSVDELSPSRHRKDLQRSQSPNLNFPDTNTKYLSPATIGGDRNVNRKHRNLSDQSHNSSASDLSLSTDDLAFNFMLQSQLKMNSSQSSVDGGETSGIGRNSRGVPKKKLSFPDYNSKKAQSAWDLSPRKFEQETISADNREVVHSESLSVLNRRSFNFEEFFVHADNSGSSLAQEAINAADVLKEKK